MAALVYVETSVISYLTARPSRDLIAAARQAITRDWWDRRRAEFDLYSSQLVEREAAGGDPEAARRRLEVVAQMKRLAIDEQVADIASAILELHYLPTQATDDAVHIAVAIRHKMDFLLTWNCSHIANAEIQRSIGEYCSKNGLSNPTVCTPEELMGTNDD